jgi:hypothetical protein
VGELEEAEVNEMRDALQAYEIESRDKVNQASSEDYEREERKDLDSRSPEEGKS